MFNSGSWVRECWACAVGRLTLSATGDDRPAGELVGRVANPSLRKHGHCRRAGTHVSTLGRRKADAVRYSTAIASTPSIFAVPGMSAPILTVYLPGA